MEQFHVMEDVELFDQNNDSILLKYYLLEEKGRNHRNNYGIMVEKCHVAEDGQYHVVENETISGISESREFTMDTLQKLHSHQITPMCVEEVVDDLITMESWKERD